MDTRQPVEATSASASNGTLCISAEVIEALAHAKWVARGRPPGTPMQDWFEAEAELLRAVAGAPALEHFAERQRAEAELKKSYNLLRAIIEGTSDAIFVKDLHGRYLMINAAGANLLGRKIEEVLGKDDTALFSADTARPIMERDRAVLASGTVQTYEDVGTAAGVTRIYLSTKAPYRDPQGRIVGLVGISREITERKRAEEMLQARVAQQAGVAALSRQALENPRVLPLLQKATSLVARTLDVKITGLWRPDKEGKRLRLWAGTGWADGLVGHALVGMGSESLAGHVLVTGEPLIVPDLDAEKRCKVPQLLRDHGIQSALAVVVQGKKKTYGVLVALSGRARTFSNDDVFCLQGIANVLAAALERRRSERVIRDTREELRIARRIQKQLFPESPPNLPGFEFGGVSHPARATGGDYFDYVPMPEDCVGVVVGDVSGHGVGPALLMVEVRALLRGLVKGRGDVGEVLQLLNRDLANDIRDDRFITMLLACLDPRRRTLAYASAGHPAGYVLDSSGNVKRLLDSNGIPLGLIADFAYHSKEPIAVADGDLVLLLTDGIVEARGRDKKTFGEERALDLVRRHRHESAQQIVDRLYRAVCDFSDRKQREDDITAVVVKVG